MTMGRNHKRAIFTALLLIPAVVATTAVGCAKRSDDDGAALEPFDGPIGDASTKPKSERDAAKADAGQKSRGSRASDDPVIERGRYLVDNVAGCGDCHTPGGATPDPSLYLSGVECLIDLNGDGTGCLRSGNLTPSGGGLGRRTDAQVKAMFMNGRRPEGSALSPVMPYWVFHNMTDEDADAIVKYLRWIDPVERVMPPNSIAFMTRKPAAAIDKNTIPKAKGSVDGGPDAENGRYLATMAGRCLECHTPDLPNGIRPIDMTKPFVGNRAWSSKQLGLAAPPMPEMIYSSNITSAFVAGIGEYSTSHIIRAIRDGLDHNGGKMCPPMPSGIGRAYAGLTDKDALDIATYIKNLPPEDEFANGTCVIQLD